MKNELVSSFERCLLSSDSFAVPPKLMPDCLCGVRLIKFTHIVGKRKCATFKCAVCDRLKGAIFPALSPCECSCREVVITSVPESTVHDAALICPQCESFLKWLSKPV